MQVQDPGVERPEHAGKRFGGVKVRHGWIGRSQNMHDGEVLQGREIRDRMHLLILRQGETVRIKYVRACPD